MTSCVQWLPFVAWMKPKSNLKWSHEKTGWMLGRAFALVFVIQWEYMLFVSETLATHLFCICELWMLYYNFTHVHACLSIHLSPIWSSRLSYLLYPLAQWLSARLEIEMSQICVVRSYRFMFLSKTFNLAVQYWLAPKKIPTFLIFVFLGRKISTQTNIATFWTNPSQRLSKLFGVWWNMFFCQIIIKVSIKKKSLQGNIFVTVDTLCDMFVPDMKDFDNIV